MQGLSLRPRGIEPAVALADYSAATNIGLVLELGTGGVQIPDNNADVPYCVLVEPGASGDTIGVVSLGNSVGEVPLRAKSAIAKGDLLCMATGSDRGKSRTLPTSGGGTVYIYGRAKAASADGSLFPADVFSPIPYTVPA